MYPNLFNPIKINQVEIKNRIVYPSLGLLYSYDRKLNDRYFNYFRARAQGGAGIVTVGPVGVDYIGSGILALGIDQDEAIPSFQKLSNIIRDSGATPWIQLFHAGAYSHPILIDGQTPLAPSPIYTRYSKTTPKEMSLSEIEKTQKAFVDAALRAKEAGFGGVEIIASAGYLLTQFLSPLRNERTDQYGGSFENRIRFAMELIRLTRQALGPDYPLTIRMAGNDFVPGSNTDLETPAIAKAYQDAGVDAISVTGGWHESKVPQLPMDLPRTAYAFLALNIKKAVSLPVMASNRISDPGSADKLIQDGYADMVNLGRVLIADPNWPRKAKQGRAAEIRPCVACSQGCTDQIFSGQPVFCIANPCAGYEKERTIVPTENPKKVMVIGAGPAGLEAAVTASAAGHQVQIYERTRDIGGQLWLAGAPPHKRELIEFIRYYRAMLKKYAITTHLGIEVTTTMIKTQKPDFVIVAEGAEPLEPPIQGLDDPCVLSSWKVLRDNPPLGKKVAIIGGGAVGLETALFVAAKGTINAETLHFLFTYKAESNERLRELLFNGSSRVTVFEMLPKAGQDVGKSTRWILFDQLKRYHVDILTNAKVLFINNGKIVYEQEGQSQEQFDHIILASGSKPLQTLSQAIENLGIPHITIGDCIRPGKINHAIHGGFLAAVEIDK